MPSLRTMRRRTPPPGWAFRLVAALIIVIVRLLRWRIDVRGVEHVPTEGGAVIAFNHHSYADFVMAAWPLYLELGRGPRFLAKEELFRKPVFGWLIRQAKQVPVARGSRTGRAEAFREAIAALQRGELIAIAPEQTISRSFELLPFSTGAARMAQGAGVPIIPCVGWGTQRFATKGRPVRPARGIAVTVRYGEPFHVLPDEDVHRATERLRQRMATLLDEVQRSYPDVPAEGDDWWVPRRLGGTAPHHDDVLRAHLDRETGWRRGA